MKAAKVKREEHVLAVILALRGAWQGSDGGQLLPNKDVREAVGVLVDLVTEDMTNANRRALIAKKSLQELMNKKANAALDLTEKGAAGTAAASVAARAKAMKDALKKTKDAQSQLDQEIAVASMWRIWSRQRRWSVCWASSWCLSRRWRTCSSCRATGLADQ